jgi:hypothetical protein
MQINTKYNIGDVLFLPRSFERYASEIVIIDGKEYTHNSVYHEPIVRQKVITAVHVNVVTGYQHVKYTLKHVNGMADGEIGRYYDEEELDRGFNNEREAMALAEEYAIHQKKEYYG